MLLTYYSTEKPALRPLRNKDHSTFKTTILQSHFFDFFFILIQ